MKRPLAGNYNFRWKDNTHFHLLLHLFIMKTSSANKILGFLIKITCSIFMKYLKEIIVGGGWNKETTKPWYILQFSINSNKKSRQNITKTLEKVCMTNKVTKRETEKKVMLSPGMDIWCILCYLLQFVKYWRLKTPVMDWSSRF